MFNQPKFPNNVSAALEKTVRDGTLQEDLISAYAFVAEMIDKKGPFAPKGCAAPILTAQDIKDKITGAGAHGGGDKVLFSGSLSMLNLWARVAAVEDADVAKMTTAFRLLQSPGDVHTVLPIVPIDATFIGEELTELKRADGDESIDAVIFAMWINQDTTATVLETCQNLVFSAFRCGEGSDQETQRLRMSEADGVHIAKITAASMLLSPACAGRSAYAKKQKSSRTSSCRRAGKTDPSLYRTVVPILEMMT